MLQPLLKLVRQRHGVGGDNEAVDAARPVRAVRPVQGLRHLFRKKGWPQALERGQRAQVLALLGPRRPGVGEACPQAVGALACGYAQLLAVRG